VGDTFGCEDHALLCPELSSRADTPDTVEDEVTSVTADTGRTTVCGCVRSWRSAAGETRSAETAPAPRTLGTRLTGACDL